MNNNTELKKIMRDYPQLTRREIASLTRSKNVSTVDRWLAPATLKGEPNPTFRRMPDVKMFVLQMALSSIRVIEKPQGNK